VGGRRRQHDQLRQRFFQAGADSLASLGLIEAANRYVCPQCVRAFLPQAVEARALTLEHAPSRRLGGKAITLTCVDCNPQAGSRLEAALMRERQLENFLRGKPGRWRGKLITEDDIGASVTIVAEADVVKIAGLPRHSNPDAHRTAFDYFERHVGRSDWRFKVQLPGYDRRRAAIGHLRTAYIAAFAKLGYAFLLNPLGARLRSQIANPEREDMTGFLATTRLPVDPSARALAICDAPFSCLAVQMGRRVVILPWPPSGVDPYDAVQHTGDALGKMHGKAMEWPTGMELVLDKLVAAQQARLG